MLLSVQHRDVASGSARVNLVGSLVLHARLVGCVFNCDMPCHLFSILWLKSGWVEKAGWVAGARLIAGTAGLPGRMGCGARLGCGAGWVSGAAGLRALLASFSSVSSKYLNKVWKKFSKNSNNAIVQHFWYKFKAMCRWHNSHTPDLFLTLKIVQI